MARPSRVRRSIACCLLAAAALTGAARADQPQWGYQGRHGAQAWGDLAPGFATCKTGRHQAPIDIRDADTTKAALPEIRFGYMPARGRMVNNGHTIQVNMPPAGGIGLADGEYQLTQYHFHAPSEERINGRRYAMGVHLVHRDAQGKLAVVAVLMRLGKENQALKPLFARLPARPGDKVTLPLLNPIAMLPPDRGYYRFTGSLTTPPCSEEVSWQVLKQPVEISAAQLHAFRRLYPMNARPIQPRNGRTIESD
ncbi:carbonic anhydrase [Caenimonas terrae]|uniref:carbonic anhydrase n=1 Tax=Caenimonas terrae TaxID=696074 RepID=A0ABW0NDZ1_9BURK